MASSTRTADVRRLLRATAGLVTTALVLVGCGANFNAQSEQQYQPAVGVNSRTAGVYVIDTLVVTDGKGNGTVVSALINQQSSDDTLQSVTAQDLHGHSLQVSQLPNNGVRLPSGQAVQLGDSGAVRISGSPLLAGGVITLTFTFAQASPKRLEVPVVTDSSTYSRVPVGPMSSTPSAMPSSP